MSKRRSRPPRPRPDDGRPRSCPVCRWRLNVLAPGTDLDRFVSPWGRIRSRRATGTCARHQRQVARAVKRARELALIAPPARGIPAKVPRR